jgi:LEA14-like dessication related protein
MGMKHRIFIVFSGLVLAALLAGCLEVKSPQAQFQGYDIQDMTMQGTLLSFKFLVDNPNPIGLDKAAYDYVLNIEGQDVLAEKDVPFTLPAGRESTLNVPVNLEYLKVFKTADAFMQRLLSGTDNIGYDFTGNLKFDILAIPISIPFAQHGQIPLPKIPGMKVQSITLENAGFSEVRLRVNMELTNPNAFPLLPQGLDYQLKVNGQQLSRGTGNTLPQLNTNGRMIYPLLISLNPFMMGQNVVSLLQGQNIQYNLDGTFHTNGLDIPFQGEGQILK